MSKHKIFGNEQNSKTIGRSPSAAETHNRNKIQFIPSLNDVAEKAYFSYAAQGYIDGHDERHWLEAEAELRAQVNRLHESHNYLLRSSQSSYWQ